MTRTKKIFVALAMAAATAGAAASPALADSHIPAPPRDGHTVSVHGDSHIPAPPTD
ncbi:hypothetical protein [Streptomyces atriruber]|uniref:hypothetical protein n=1 Tax=Streptomyces atriruber TaxID=545121 RepID=UPI000AAE38B6|nr:hypothetical protein [Streptomyces atriruber]